MTHNFLTKTTTNTHSHASHTSVMIKLEISNVQVTVSGNGTIQVVVHSLAQSLSMLKKFKLRPEDVGKISEAFSPPEPGSPTTNGIGQ